MLRPNAPTMLLGGGDGCCAPRLAGQRRVLCYTGQVRTEAAAARVPGRRGVWARAPPRRGARTRRARRAGQSHRSPRCPIRARCGPAWARRLAVSPGRAARTATYPARDRPRQAHRGLPAAGWKSSLQRRSAAVSTPRSARRTHHDGGRCRRRTRPRGVAGARARGSGVARAGAAARAGHVTNCILHVGGGGGAAYWAAHGKFAAPGEGWCGRKCALPNCPTSSCVRDGS